MTKFKRVPDSPYTLITPMSPLADLEQFLKDNIFALGAIPNLSLSDFELTMNV